MNLFRKSVSSGSKILCNGPNNFHFIKYYNFFFCYTTWHTGSQFPDQGLNSHSPQRKFGVLILGLPGSPQYFLISVSADMTEATQQQQQSLSWRRKWQPTPVFLPGESCGQRSLVGCCPWGRTESDTTEVTQQQQQQQQCSYLFDFPQNFLGYSCIFFVNSPSPLHYYIFQDLIQKHRSRNKQHLQYCFPIKKEVLI